jgi:hypothetical protein
MNLFTTLNSLREDGFSNKRRLKEAFLISFVFLIIELIIIQFHEVWRDEIETWAIAMNSHSIGELFYNSRYEGHPKLWFLLVYALQRFTHVIFGMQVMHLCIASLTVFVFSYFSPFNFLKNILFCFGYFFAYEYSIISRNYGIEMLFLFLITGLFLRYKEKHLLVISVLFFLMLQTNVYGVIVGIVFYCYVILSLYEDKSLKTGSAILSAIIFLSALVITVISMIPPPDSGVVLGWNTTFNSHHLYETLSTITRSYYPVPLFMHESWNSNYLDYFWHREEMKTLGSIITIIVVVLLFYNKRKIFILFIIGTGGLLLFFYTKNLGYMRHHGHLYMLFVVCCWLFYSKDNIKAEGNIKGKMFNRIQIWINKYFLNIILIIQLFGAIVSIVKDIKYPFSNAVAVSNYLKSESLDTMKLIGDGYPQATSVAGLLNTEMYCPRSCKTEKFILWDNSRNGTTQEELLAEVSNFSHQIHRKVILVLTFPINKKPENWTFLKSFERALIYDENYFVYSIDTISICNPIDSLAK